MRTSFAIALGSNMSHPRFGRPEAVIRKAFSVLDEGPTTLLRASPIMRSDPVGPSLRIYANAAALIETALEPLSLLDHLKSLESEFGRRTRGQRWRARVLDLDILLWSEGPFAAPGLYVPHLALAERRFVLHPLCAVAPDWRDPRTGISVRQLKARLDRKRPAA